MTLKQERFIAEYLVDLNGAAAAIRAGYAKKRARQTAYDLLGRSDIQDAIVEAQAARSERLKIDQDYVLDGLRQNHDAAVDAGQFAVVNRTLELMGKHLGMFTERRDITIGNEPITGFRLIYGPEDSPI